MEYKAPFEIVIFTSHTSGRLISGVILIKDNINREMVSLYKRRFFKCLPTRSFFKVISATAQELSQPVDEDPKSLRKHLPLPSIPGITPRDKPDWQVVVEERIKSKTRIISRVSTIFTSLDAL